MARQDPWDDVPVVRLREPVQPQAGQQPASSASPWDSVPVARVTAPQRQAQPSPVAASSVTALALNAPVTDPNAPLTREERINALLDQGYEPDEAIRQADEQIAFEGLEGSPLAGEPAGAPMDQGPSSGYQIPEGVTDWLALTDEQRGQLTRGTRVLLPPEEPGGPRQIVTLARDLNAPLRDAVMGEQRQTIGGVQTYTPGVADSVGAFASGAAEQLPFVDEAAVAADALLSNRSFSEARDEYQLTQDALNRSNRGERVAGGVTGFAAGFLAPGAGYIGRGANLAQRATRSAQVGAGYGALYGGGAAEGGFGERFQAAAQGATIGAATGGLLQMGADRFAGIGSIAGAGQRPSQARRLSRAGIDLTPGQMASEVPLVGPALRALEEGASSIPVAGSAIAGARQRGTEAFNRVTINTALEPIGVTVPENIPVGYPAVEFAQQALSRAYDDVLQDVVLTPDQQLYDGLGAAINSAVENSGAPGARRIAREIQERVFRYLGDNAEAPITGEQFKALEGEFTTLASNALNATDGATQAVGRAYQAVNEALREALERQNPGRREALRAVNDAYSRMVRVETAAGSSASQATEGVFSPTQLGVAVSSQSGRRASARGDAQMQGLVAPARGILNSRIGDSGTATRGAVTALASGAAGTAAVMNPAVAVPVIVGVSALYSRPAQRALNALYRATDNPQAARRHLARLASLARREPALQPYYQEAVRYVTGQEPLQQREPASRNPAQEQRPAA